MVLDATEPPVAAVLGLLPAMQQRGGVPLTGPSNPYGDRWVHASVGVLKGEGEVIPGGEFQVIGERQHPGRPAGIAW